MVFYFGAGLFWLNWLLFTGRRFFGRVKGLGPKLKVAVNLLFYMWLYCSSLYCDFAAFTAHGDSFAVEFVKICRYKTFWMRIFKRTTFLLFRCYSIHVKLCVLKQGRRKIDNWGGGQYSYIRVHRL